jgi:hypothetical protein
MSLVHRYDAEQQLVIIRSALLVHSRGDEQIPRGRGLPSRARGIHLCSVACAMNARLTCQKRTLLAIATPRHVAPASPLGSAGVYVKHGSWRDIHRKRLVRQPGPPLACECARSVQPSRATRAVYNYGASYFTPRRRKTDSGGAGPGTCGGGARAVGGRRFPATFVASPLFPTLPLSSLGQETG